MTLKDMERACKALQITLEELKEQVIEKPGFAEDIKHFEHVLAYYRAQMDKKRYITQTDYACELVRQGEWKKAIYILKGFSMYFTGYELRKLQIAYDGMIGRGDFYRQLGVDTDIVIEEAKEIINKFIERKQK